MARISDSEGKRAVLALLALVSGLAILMIVYPFVWRALHMHWLDTGAALPKAMQIERTLYTHLETDFCSEAVYKLAPDIARSVREEGVSFLNASGPNRDGETFVWRPMSESEHVGGYRLDQGPLCQSELPAERWFGWGPPAIAFYNERGFFARDGHGTLLIVHPDEGLAYYLND